MLCYRQTSEVAETSEVLHGRNKRIIFMKTYLRLSIGILLIASLFLMGCGEDGKSITSPTAAAQLPTSTSVTTTSGNGICPYCTADPATCPYHAANSGTCPYCTANPGDCPNGTCPYCTGNPGDCPYYSTNSGTYPGNGYYPRHGRW